VCNAEVIALTINNLNGYRVSCLTACRTWKAVDAHSFVGM